MGPKSFISGTDFFLRIVELHYAKLTVVSSLAKGETSPFCTMDIGVIRCTQSSTDRHTEQYSLLGKEVRLKVKAVFEKHSTLADPLSTRLCRSMWKQEHRWTGRSDCGRTHPGTAYWACTSRQSLCSVPDTGTDSILQGTPVTAPKLTVQRQMFRISIATEKLTTWKLLFSLALLHTSPMLKECSHARHLKAFLTTFS